MSDPSELAMMESNSDLYLVQPSKSKPRHTKKSECGNRKVEHNWTVEEIQSLIAAVEKRPRLWDAGSAEYKLSKLDGWREVVEELGLDISVNEVKSKWGCLRVTFKANLSKIRLKKSGQGTESPSVSWQFFSQMMFLEANDVQRSTPTVSSMDVVCDPIDTEVSPPLPSTSAVVVGQRRKRRCQVENQTSLSSSSSSPLASARLAILNSAVSALNASDKNSAFCDYLAFQLRDLPEHQADYLRSMLNRNMLDFLDEIQSQSSQQSPVHFVDDDGREININALQQIIVENDEEGIARSAIARPITERPLSPSTDDLEIVDVE